MTLMDKERKSQGFMPSVCPISVARITQNAADSNRVRAHARSTEHLLMVATDRRAKTDSLVRAIDLGKGAGFKSIALTTISLD